MKPDEYITARKKAKKLKVANHPDRPEIVSNRPIPEEKRGGVRKFDHFYPFEEMKPGDSFWVPSATQCTAGAISKFSKRTGWKFISRGQLEDGRPNSEGRSDRKGASQRGTRVWRIS